MKAIQCALKSNDAATSDFGVISLSLLSTERQWYEGHIHPQQLHSYLWCFSPHSTHLHCSASVSSCSCPRPAYSSPPAFFLNPSLSPSLKALLFSCEDLDSSGDSGFVVRKMATFSFRTKFSARMLTYTTEEPGRSSVFSMWITEHILFPVKRVRVGRCENECVWMLHL